MPKVSVSDTKVPYEILIRFDENGKLKGAHKTLWRVVKIGQEIVATAVDDAQPISVNDGALWGVLDETHTQALSDNSTMRAQLAEKDRQIAMKDQQIGALEVEVANARK